MPEDRPKRPAESSLWFESLFLHVKTNRFKIKIRKIMVFGAEF